MSNYDLHKESTESMSDDQGQKDAAATTNTNKETKEENILYVKGATEEENLTYRKFLAYMEEKRVTARIMLEQDEKRKERARKEEEK